MKKGIKNYFASLKPYAYIIIMTFVAIILCASILLVRFVPNTGMNVRDTLYNTWDIELSKTSTLIFSQTTHLSHNGLNFNVRYSVFEITKTEHYLSCNKMFTQFYNIADGSGAWWDINNIKRAMSAPGVIAEEVRFALIFNERLNSVNLNIPPDYMITWRVHDMFVFFWGMHNITLPNGEKEVFFMMRPARFYDNNYIVRRLYVLEYEFRV